MSTYPVGVPPVTVAVNSVDWLGVMEVSEAMSPVVLVKAVFQSVSRFCTFTVPMPVTWSNPGAEGKATDNELEPVNDKMPLT